LGFDLGAFNGSILLNDWIQCAPFSCAASSLLKP